ncbi:uncharacterized protein EV422DRAFT_520955 [Fimicolochytrium jonesii]|uniref:uncharacterized protein n=1 Tax=Fimicolochytrium jonesii TaxID=1396493 RepID=UPI0022FEF2EA|nr:uncharacterized protein EV422DRAFT_520955 [Fimicolochytrium jonesii]KAI8823418.1 hypothetical protein EV422DRAFT_520955 [Fimicolochytrium jonesii]
MSGIVNRATETVSTTAQNVAAVVDPYVPQVAKNVANYALGTAVAAKDLAASTVTSAQGTAVAAKDRAVNTATGAVNFASTTVNNTTSYASNKVTEAIDFGKIVVTGATTTITSYTPNPILNLVQGTVEQAKSLHSDPVGTVKNYVPTFVIHAGEKTYEVVHNTKERAVGTANATTGFVVTKVNGVVHSVTSIPQIHNLIEQLEKLAAPVLNKLGVSKHSDTTAVPVNAETPVDAPVAPVDAPVAH